MTDRDDELTAAAYEPTPDRGPTTEPPPTIEADAERAIVTTFIKIIRALEPLTEAGRTRVIAAAHALYAHALYGARKDQQ